jgi:hypothetical protein
MEPNLIFHRDLKNVIKLKLKDFELKKSQAQTPLEKFPNKFYNVKTKIKHTFLKRRRIITQH